MSARPTCCKKAGKHIRLMYEEYYVHDAEHFVKTKPRWSLGAYSEEYESYHKVFIAFCPFCAKPLPDIKLVDQLPEPVMTITDGGYRCGTCGERLHACQCAQPEEMWELVLE